jgi:hypothetical protein
LVGTEGLTREQDHRGRLAGGRGASIGHRGERYEHQQKEAVRQV